MSWTRVNMSKSPEMFILHRSRTVQCDSHNVKRAAEYTLYKMSFPYTGVPKTSFSAVYNYFFPLFCSYSRGSVLWKRDSYIQTKKERSCMSQIRLIAGLSKNACIIQYTYSTMLMLFGLFEPFTHCGSVLLLSKVTMRFNPVLPSHISR